MYRKNWLRWKGLGKNPEIRNKKFTLYTKNLLCLVLNAGKYVKTPLILYSNLLLVWIIIFLLVKSPYHNQAWSNHVKDSNVPVGKEIFYTFVESVLFMYSNFNQCRHKNIKQRWKIFQADKIFFKKIKMVSDIFHYPFYIIRRSRTYTISANPLKIFGRIYQLFVNIRNITNNTQKKQYNKQYKNWIFILVV